MQDSIRVLNAKRGYDLKAIFGHSQQEGSRLESDVDDQLIIQIPFSGSVRIKSLRMALPVDVSSPVQVDVFVNNQIDFDSASTLKPTQTIICLPPEFHKNKVIEYSLKAHLFANVTSLSILVKSSVGGKTSAVEFIGFTGDFLNTRRAPVITEYEVKPNVADHKTEADWKTVGGNPDFMPTDREQLLEFGFTALKATGNKGLQAALDWLDNNDGTGDTVPSGDKGKDPLVTILNEEKSEAITDKPSDEVIPEGFKKALQCNVCSISLASIELAQLHATKTGHEDFSEAVIKKLTEAEKEQKMAELKEKLAEKRQREADEEKEREKQSELIKRKAGKELEDVKREREKREMDKLRAEQQRQKEEDQKAKERVLAMIEEDRREREAKLNKTQQPVKPVESDSPPPPPPATDTARVQIRLPLGPPLRLTLKSEDTLAKLVDEIDKLQPGVLEGHILMTAIPSTRPLTALDHKVTLASLGLSPSGTLILHKTS